MSVLPSNPSEMEQINALQTRFAELERELQQCRCNLEQELAAKQQTEIRLNDILNSAIAAIISFRVFDDLSWKYDYFSAGCETVFGFTSEELMADEALWRNRVHPDDYSVAITQFLAAIQKCEQSQKEYRFFHKDGSLRWISSVLATRYDEAAKCWVVTAVDTDITDRKHTENALRESEARFRQIAENVQEAFFVESADASEILYINPAYERIWGRSPELLYQNPQAWMDAVLPEDQNLVSNALQKKLKGQAIQDEFRILRPDGRIRWIYGRTTPVFDDSGQLVCHVGMAEDITLRKEVELRWRQQTRREQAFSQVVQSIRKSLSLETIFSTAIAEIAQLLKVEQVVLVQYLPERRCWVHLAEYIKNAQRQPTIGFEIPDEGNPFAAQLKQLQVVRVDTNHSIHDPINLEVAKSFPTAWLLTPIATNEGIWGSLTLHKADQTVPWQDDEVELAWRVADQLAIAIQQAALYEQAQVELEERQRAEAALQKLNQELELRVQARTQELQASQEILRQRKQEFRTLVDNAPDIIIRLDSNLCCLYANPAIEAITDISHTVLIGKSWHEIGQTMGLVTLWEKVIQKALSTQTEQTVEFVIPAAAGMRYFQSRFVPEFAPNGSLESTLIIARDITSLKRAEVALRQSEELFRRLFEESPIGIALNFAYNTQLTKVNRRFCEMLGYQPEDLMTLTDKAITYPDDWLVEQPLLDQLTAGDIATYQLEKRYIQRHGEPLWVQFTTTAIRDPRGTLLFSLAMAEDISQRKRIEAEHQQAEMALRQSEEQFRRLFQDAPIAIALVHPQTYRFLHVNAMYSTMTGYSAAELLEMTFVDLTYAEDIEKDTVLAKRVANGEISQFQMEKRLISKSGEIKWANLTTTLIRDQSGTPLYSMGMIEDISERKQAEEQLKASLQEKEVLLKEIHHRVKNNLQIISSLLRMQSRQTNDAYTGEFFKEAQDRVQSMAFIHEQLYQSPNLSSIDFGDYLQTLVNHLFRSYGINHKQVLLSIETNGMNLTLNSAIPCGLIVNELVSNSLKYAFPNGQQGKISIHLHTQSTPEVMLNTQVLLKITDDGVGISQDIIWQNTHSLGLRIVRNLVAQLKGNISLDRQHGTSFTITFPIASQPGANKI